MSLDPICGGGTAERTLQISRALAQAGVNCRVLTTDAKSIQEDFESFGNVEVIVLPCLFNRFYIPKFSIKSIRSIVAESDIIHLMNHWTLINAIVYLVIKQLAKPYVVCPAGALPIYGRSKLIKKLYNWIIGNKIIRNASGHVAIAMNEIDHFKSYKVQPDKVSLIPNGINQKDFISDDAGIFRSKYGINNHPFILFIGRLHSIKGPDLLLRAFSYVHEKFKKMHLVFAGPDNGMLKELKVMADTFELREYVHFIGYIGGVEKSRAYHAAELVVIPSRQEAMSIVVLEAGISGTPVLITDACGFDEVENIGGGRVVSATVEGLSEGLVEMLGAESNLESKGRKLKEYTFKNYTWDNVVKKYLNLYQRLLSQNEDANINREPIFLA
jgi:glycosyltransferase involved in cell wall biosynthesis